LKKSAQVIARKLNKFLESACTPQNWKSLVRHPYVDGKPISFHEGKCPYMWELGHELKSNEDGSIMWYCFSIASFDFFDYELYVHHSIQLYPDAKLIGKMFGDGYGNGQINMRDLNDVFKNWSDLLAKKEEKY
jgi:hypothetical protein